MDEKTTFDPGFDIKAQSEKVRILIEKMTSGFDAEKLSADGGPLRYVIYARKSTDRKYMQERSIMDQIQECRDYAKREGLRWVHVIHEEQSAKLSGTRPQFTTMLDEIAAGTYDAILS